MCSLRHIASALAFVLAASMAASVQSETRRPTHPLYQAVRDDVYLQEAASKISTDQPVTAVATLQGRVYAAVEGQLHELKQRDLSRVANAPSDIQRLFSLANSLWCTTANGVYRFRHLDQAATKVHDSRMVDMCLHGSHVVGATDRGVFRFQNGQFVDLKPPSGWLSSDVTLVRDDGTQVLADPVSIGPIRRLASYSGTLYLLGNRGPTLLDGPTYQRQPVDWGAMPSRTSRDMLAAGSRLMMATDRGVAVLRGAALTTIDGENGLPYEDTTCLALGFANDLWIGTTTGAIRNIGDQYHYFGADHWLPGDNIHDIAVDAEGKRVFIATDRGIGVISYMPFTLQQKSDFFEQQLEAWGHKRLGFVHQLYWSDEHRAWLREISDNDGGHTAHYLAALCFKYAVTKNEQTRRQAVDAWEAMVWLQAITGTDGFFARSIWAVDVDLGARGDRGSGGLPAKWYATADGQWLWKGDTSSDEVNAHFYAVSLFHDLVADQRQQKRSVEHLARIAKHIVDNGWVLRDQDGQPTRWGRWDPDYLLRPYGFEARGLNGMEAQTYVWTAYKLSQDAFFRSALDQLIKWRYHTYTVREKLTYPPESVVPWDDELAFRCFHPLLIYCDDAHLRSIYLRALERHWEVMRMQKVPFFNFVYGGLTGNDCEAPQAVQHLREWSLDTVSHRYRNSHRADLAVETGYTPYMGGTRAISPRESACTWGSRSAIQYDGGGGGRIVTPPVGWLEDYWMGRYYGMIQPPSSEQRPTPMTSGFARTKQAAAAYSGPQRPDVMTAN